MATNDTCCTIVPYFKIPEGKMEIFKDFCEKFVERTSSEEKCLFYGFSFCGDEAHCREGYADADGALQHLVNVGDLLKQVLEEVELTRIEVHGPESELAKLREPMAAIDPKFFVLEYGFRR